MSNATAAAGHRAAHLALSEKETQLIAPTLLPGSSSLLDSPLTINNFCKLNSDC